MKVSNQCAELSKSKVTFCPATTHILNVGSNTQNDINLNFFRNIILIFVIICFTNCASRNEYGIVRPNKIRFSNKNCEDEKVFEKIDTSVIYLTEYKWPEKNGIHYNGYKFYSDNKVAFFIDIKIDSGDALNPKKAQMGFYSTCSEINNIQIAYHHVQSGIFKSKKEFEIISDTLIVKTLKSPQASYGIEKYYKRKLTTNELIYKPDW
ncbi:hypothetical protein [Aquimarina brevivitae]|uniref:Uncharacterized protein n=1 Tax=Aquimarina brevivitae TaxID=323412 RepID=A0A4Q7NUH8_9FLAO|nr:hypothetical protein [Aquimarina brevivitae]RZS90765.1 hypothetical protein EV197_3299 [Aquimarina brevivitae]